MTVEHFPWLTALVLFPLLAAIPIPLLPDSEAKSIRWYTLGACLAELGLIIYTFANYYDLNQAGLQLVDIFAWVPQIGLIWSLAADGLSMPLVILSGLVTTLAAVASWNVTMKPRLYFSMLLLMYSAQVGVFLAQDMLMSFFMLVLDLFPVYQLISICFGQIRLYAAT